MSALEDQFHKAMLRIYDQAKRECHYPATYFLQMVIDRGGLNAARSLLATIEPSSGFTALWECGRLDLTVEALVLQTDFRSLFTDEELNTARNRLIELGYDPKSK